MNYGKPVRKKGFHIDPRKPSRKLAYADNQTHAPLSTFPAFPQHCPNSARGTHEPGMAFFSGNEASYSTCVYCHERIKIVSPYFPEPGFAAEWATIDDEYTIHEDEEIEHT